MDKIIINKYTNQIHMWDIFRIYQSITDEFLHEFNAKKELIESQLDNSLNIIVYCSIGGDVKLTLCEKNNENNEKQEKLTIELKPISYNIALSYDEKDRFYRENDGKKVESYTIKKKKMYDIHAIIKYKEENLFFLSKYSFLSLAELCSDFFASMIREEEIKKDSEIVRHVPDFDFDSIYNYLIMEYIFYFGKRKCNIIMTKDGAQIKIVGPELDDSKATNNIKDGPVIDLDKLPKLVKQYIETHKTDDNFYTYSVSLTGNENISTLVEKPIKKPRVILEPPKEIKPIIKPAKEASEEERQEYKKRFFRDLLCVDKKDEECGNKLLISPLLIEDDYLFFSSITDEKKEIDPFFRDNPGVLQYCNLSFVDFDRADIRRFDLSKNPEARLKLKRLYNQDITGTNLKNNYSLSLQSLEGIKADRANLTGTNVCVPIDKFKYHDNTIFDDGCFFDIGLEKVEPEQARSMGYIVETKKYLNGDYIRAGLIILQNLVYENGVSLLLDEDTDRKIK